MLDCLKTVQSALSLSLKTMCTVDFKNDAESAREEINGWIAQQTANRIQDLLPQGCLDAMTRLVITNAVYFLGTWDETFDKENTHPAEFFLADGKETHIPTMHQIGHFSFAESSELKMLRLPYQSYGVEIQSNEDSNESFLIPNEVDGGGFAMEVLLPAPESDTNAVAELLASNSIQGLPDASSREVHVYLPKFRVESTYFLAQTLKTLGVREAFSMEKADFSAMSDNPEGLFVSEVAHKAFVDVNEEGTEAAAATAILMAGAGFVEPLPPVEFKADRPFVFLIRDIATDLIHFVGRLEEPINQ